jgi:mRNA interferase MazF
MKRGDVVTVAATGDYGKTRPAVIVQTDALPAEHASVVICHVTPECSDAPAFRVTIDPTRSSGLRVRSQVMADKPVTVRRERIGRQVGFLDDKDTTRLNVALAFVMGLADKQSWRCLLGDRVTTARSGNREPRIACRKAADHRIAR